MRRRPLVSGILTVGAAVAVISTVTSGACPAGAATTTSDAAAGTRAAAVAGPAHQTAAKPLFLLTGEQIVTHAGGVSGGASVLAGPGQGSGSAGQLQVLDLGGQSYAVPLTARPYLGRGLDPSLFQVSALARAESNRRLPVRIGYPGALPALPGVTITSSGSGVATGYLTAAGARRFGAALARQFAIDHSDGGYGQQGMFAGGTSIALAGAAGPAAAAARSAPTAARPAPIAARPAPTAARPAPIAARSAPTAARPAATAARPAAGAQRHVRPRFAMHTLTVVGTTLSGRADTGDPVNIIDADNASRFWTFGQDINFFYHGVTKFSVPTGHFWLSADFVQFKHGRPYATRMDLLPEITVRKNMTVRLTAKAASSRLQFVTSKPATVQSSFFEQDYLTAESTPTTPFRCCAESDTFISFGAFPLYVSPVASVPSTGTLINITSGQLASPRGASGAAYHYAVAYQSPGIVPPQRFVVNQATLATENARYFSAAPQTGYLAIFPGFPIERELGSTAVLPRTSYPLRQTTYFTANPALAWTTQYILYGHVLNFSGGQSGAPQIFQPGQRLTEDWGSYPLHPAPNAQPTRVSHTFPATASATRAGDKLGLAMNAFDDNTPGHVGGGIYRPFRASGSYVIDQNGTRIAGGTLRRFGGYFGARATLSPARSLIKVVLNAAQPASLSPLSTSSRTTWTWWSAHQAGGTLPPGWICAMAYNRSCAAQPLMTLRYGVLGERLTGTASPGQQVIRLAVGHQQLATASKITGTAMSVSFDGGHTWRTAQLTGHGGSYAAVFNAPAGAKVMLRTTATDAAGGSITQTITNAYRTAATGGTAAVRAACPAAGPRQARCYALYAPQARVNAAIAARAAGGPVSPGAATPHGWGAKDIESAYKLPVTKGAGQTVALVDAFSTPHLASDLAVYRKQYGLPPCTTASGCLRIVNQQGKAAPLPRPDPYGWGVEETLDVSMVSAACPRCKIIVVEARTPTFGNLATAEDTAARLGAQVMSNSYGARESGYSQAKSKAYRHPGHVVVASSGDVGFTAANFPANLAAVTAVGGTKLARAHNARGWTESVWNNNFGASSSGCSAYVAKPAWQHDPHCPGRTVADVAALASNVPVYDSSISKSQGGPWLTVYGTSAASPLIAGVYALAGNAATVQPGHEYTHPSALFDVTTGNNDWFTRGHGAVCGHDYLCVARPGYDAPTGLGTPDGTRAF